MTGSALSSKSPSLLCSPAVMTMVMVMVVMTTFLVEGTVGQVLTRGPNEPRKTCDKIYGYHFHTYFFNNTESKEAANKLFQEAKNLWPDLRIVKFDEPVGPHTLPMFEIDVFDDKYLGQIIPWIMQHHGDLRVLLHPLCDNELPAHTIYPFWIEGKVVPLDVTKL